MKDAAAKVEAALLVIDEFADHGGFPDECDRCGLHFRIESHYQALLDKLKKELGEADFDLRDRIVGHRIQIEAGEDA